MRNGHHPLMSKMWKGKNYTRLITPKMITGIRKMNNIELALQAIKQKKQEEINTQTNSATINPTPTSTWTNPRKKKTLKLRTQIKTERTAKKWTQRDLAKASGMSQGSITRAENHMYISLNCLMKIATALGKELVIN